MNLRLTLCLACILLLVLLSGCSLHSPAEIALSPAAIPASFAEQEGAPEEPLDGKWWLAFGDRRLNALMEEALAGNLELKQAFARLEQAEAVLSTARAARLPTLDLSGSAGRARQSTLGVSITDNTYSLSAPASFELDLWRRLENRADAARLETAAAREELKSLYLTLSAQVADLYFLAVEQRAQLGLADRTIAAFKETLDRVERRYREGIVGPLDVYQSRQNLAAARARRPVFANTLAATEHALAALLGNYPALQTEGARTELPEILPVFPAGVPSRLLMRRPDIEASLLRLRASDHRIAAAVADRFPALRLTGSYGSSSSEAADLFSSGNLFWNLLLNLAQPLYDGGRREAEVERTRAVFRESLSVYHQRVLTSFREVEDALVANRTGEERIGRLRDRVEASEGALRLSLDRYLQGLSDYLPVLTAQSALFEAESALLSARRELISNRITLARSLGGAWMDEELVTGSPGPADHRRPTERFEP